MVRCIVSGCISYEDDKIGPKKKFFRFPKNEDLCALWVKKVCDGGNEVDVKAAKICSDHFLEEDYRLKDILLKTELRKRMLKEGAFPSQFLPVGRFCGVEKNEIAETERKEIVQEAIAEYDRSCAPNRHTQDAVVQTEVHTETKLEQSYRKEIAALKKDLRLERKKNKRYAMQLKRSRELYQGVNHCFSKGQLRKLRNPLKRVRWSAEDISTAISLYSAGSKAYRLLRSRGFPLPAMSTLRKWSGKINLTGGILKPVLKLLKSSTYDKKERVCILSFDEMKVRSVYEYNRRIDKVLKPSKYVQVAMIRGLYKNWKQVIYYDFDSAMTATLVKEIIGVLDDINFTVVAMVCDMGPTNMGLWRELSITCETPYFLTDGNNNNKVFVFADTPHLIKLVRNHFLDSGFVLEGKIINSRPIVDLMNLDQHDLKICHKITPTHLDVKDAARQKVKYAVQLLSNTVSQAIKRGVSLGKLNSPNACETSEFIKLINDWFDLFNSSSAERGYRERMKAFDHSNETHKTIIESTSKVVGSMRVPNKKAMLPFQKGILVNNASIVQLSKSLEATYGNHYVLTRRLQQDDLERFFGYIRAKGGLYDHPTAMEFMYRLRLCILGRSDCTQQVSDWSNVEEGTEEVDDLLLTASMLSEIMDEGSTEQVDETSFSATEIELDDSLTMTEFEEDAIEYIAGYIIRKLHLRDQVADDSTGFTWVDQLSEGGLTKPSQEFKKQLMCLENCFISVHGDKLNCNENAIEKCVEMSHAIDLPARVKQLFFRTRLYNRIKSLNKASAEQSKKKRRKLNKTIT